MSTFMQRTDLALESRELVCESSSAEPDGVKYETKQVNGHKCHIMEVTTESGANELGKPIGKYFTLEINEILHRESNTFSDAASAASDIIAELLDGKQNSGSVLVVGLGNRDITPDAVGPLAAATTLVTRHLKKHLPKDFAGFNDVSVITPGVLGTTGIESADYIKSICNDLKPSAVIAVDALAARSLDRLCRTIQITNTGITPGSGVGNNRSAINQEVLGTPVIAVGLPTVVDIKSVIADICPNPDGESAFAANQMIVTPRSIDSEVACMGKLIGYALNLALHEGISIEDIDMLVG